MPAVVVAIAAMAINRIRESPVGGSPPFDPIGSIVGDGVGVEAGVTLGVMSEMKVTPVGKAGIDVSGVICC
jgi:hypothetical protein